MLFWGCINGYEIWKSRSDSGPADVTGFGAVAPSIAFSIGLVPIGISLIERQILPSL